MPFRVLALDDERVYGFGRLPQFRRWTTPLEHHLFAASRKVTAAEVTLDARGRPTAPSHA